MGKSTPAPIDYAGVAQQEADASKALTTQQTWANRPDQINPWGKVEWGTEDVIDPATGQKVTQWTQNQSLDPVLNQSLQNQMLMQEGRSGLGASMMETVGGQMGQGMDFSQFGNMRGLNTSNLPDRWAQLQWDLPQYQTGNNLMQVDYSGAPDVDRPEFTQQRAEQSIYDRGMSRLGPQQQGEKQALEIKLRNQGLTPGDEGYRSAMGTLDQKHTDATQTLENETIMGGGREAERMFGMQSGRRNQYTGELMDAADFANQASQQQFGQGMMAGSQGFQDVAQAAAFQNQARGQAWDERMAGTDFYNNQRNQAINEMLMRRSQGLNEMNALISGQQVGTPQMQGFQNAGVSQTPQMLQAAGMMGQQNAAQASADNMMMNNLMGGLSTGIGMAGMFSDRRLKSNISKIGERNGVNWYSYEIFGKPQIGVMADEVPWAAFEHPSGFLMVDYRRV